MLIERRNARPAKQPAQGERRHVAKKGSMHHLPMHQNTQRIERTTRHLHCPKLLESGRSMAKRQRPPPQLEDPEKG